jgi:sulfite reductase (ferredoxin)
MDLSQMKSDETLEILLDDGAPIDNVPRSVASEGHTILEQTKQKEGHWLVRIKKR